MRKRICSLLLCLVVLLTAVPVSAATALKITQQPKNGYAAAGQENVLARFEQAMAPAGVVEKKPVLDGRILSMVVVPAKN